jgi:hypothetical protein
MTDRPPHMSDPGTDPIEVQGPVPKGVLCDQAKLAARMKPSPELEGNYVTAPSPVA